MPSSSWLGSFHILKNASSCPFLHDNIYIWALLYIVLGICRMVLLHEQTCIGLQKNNWNGSKIYKSHSFFFLLNYTLFLRRLLVLYSSAMFNFNMLLHFFREFENFITFPTIIVLDIVKTFFVLTHFTLSVSSDFTHCTLN